MQKAFKYRFYPTSEQETLLRRTIGCTRLVYNRALSERTQMTQFCQHLFGLDLATPEQILNGLSTYLGWIDSDDRLTPATLAATVAFLDNEPEVGTVYTDHQIIDAQGNLQGYDYRCKIPYSKDRMLVEFMTFHFRLIRRDCFEQAGGINPEFKAAIDYDFCLRLSEVTQIKHLQIPLYEYRVHPQKMSSQGRYQQVQCAKAAVEQALVRRGLDKTYRLEVSENTEFILRNRLGHPEGSREMATIRV
jgi:Helix-turn-helix domain